MKVLIISHNALNINNNMGRTLMNQFGDFKEDEIAQIYFKKGLPQFDVCKDFFCIPDMDVLKSVFTRKNAGYAITKIEYDKSSSKDIANESTIETSIRSKIKGTVFMPLMKIIRNTAWTLGKWKTPDLDAWLDEVNPDVIFFASGDYSFAYAVTGYIAKIRNIPIIVGCYDDYYIDKKHSINPFYHIVRCRLLHHAKKVFKQAYSFMGLSDMMTQDYSRLFGKDGHTMHVPTDIDENETKRQRIDRIFYAGNLSLGRAKQLASIGKSIKALNRKDIRGIDVYATALRAESKPFIKEENGIFYHGRVPQEEVRNMMLTSKYVIHTESFEKDNKRRVKYSVSTKIADCLASGACIVAYGPEEVASIKYLKDSNSACVILSEDKLEEELNALFEDAGKKEEIISNALVLAQTNHNRAMNSQKFKELIFEPVKIRSER